MTMMKTDHSSSSGCGCGCGDDDGDVASLKIISVPACLPFPSLPPSLPDKGEKSRLPIEQKPLVYVTSHTMP